MTLIYIANGGDGEASHQIKGRSNPKFMLFSMKI
jgi:hypothetical protein